MCAACVSVHAYVTVCALFVFLLVGAGGNAVYHTKLTQKVLKYMHQVMVAANSSTFRLNHRKHLTTLQAPVCIQA